MKIRVNLKDPDTMGDAVDDACAKLPKPDGLTDAEWASIYAERAQQIKDDISTRWMAYGEYLLVEFDTEAQTATVIPRTAR